MKVLLSPAKSLDFKSQLPTEKISSLCFEKEAEYLNSILKRKSPTFLILLIAILNASQAVISKMELVFLGVWRSLKSMIIKTFIYFLD